MAFQKLTKDRKPIFWSDCHSLGFRRSLQLRQQFRSYSAILTAPGRVAGEGFRRGNKLRDELRNRNRLARVPVEQLDPRPNPLPGSEETALRSPLVLLYGEMRVETAQATRWTRPAQREIEQADVFEPT